MIGLHVLFVWSYLNCVVKQLVHVELIFTHYLQVGIQTLHTDILDITLNDVCVSNWPEGQET